MTCHGRSCGSSATRRTPASGETAEEGRPSHGCSALLNAASRFRRCRPPRGAPRVSESPPCAGGNRRSAVRGRADAVELLQLLDARPREGRLDAGPVASAGGGPRAPRRRLGTTTCWPSCSWAARLTAARSALRVGPPARAIAAGHASSGRDTEKAGPANRPGHVHVDARPSRRVPTVPARRFGARSRGGGAPPAAPSIATGGACRRAPLTIQQPNGASAASAAATTHHPFHVTHRHSATGAEPGRVGYCDEPAKIAPRAPAHLEDGAALRPLIDRLQNLNVRTTRAPLAEPHGGASTAAGSPSKTASTAPSTRLRTQPVTPRCASPGGRCSGRKRPGHDPEPSRDDERPRSWPRTALAGPRLRDRICALATTR